MKLKKIIAGIAAAAVTVSAMAMTAFATETVAYPAYEESDEYGKFMDMAKIYPDVASVATCEITFKDSAANGCIVLAAASTNWGWNPIDTAKDNGDGTFTYSVPCAFEASDSVVKITVQDWDESTLAEVCKIVLKDASGNVLFETGSASADAGDADAASDADTAADDDVDAGVTDEDDDADVTDEDDDVGYDDDDGYTVDDEADDAGEAAPADGNNAAPADNNTAAPATGNVAVASVAAVMAVAGAAALVSRKRK